MGGVDVAVIIGGGGGGSCGIIGIVGIATSEGTICGPLRCLG